MGIGASVLWREPVRVGGTTGVCVCGLQGIALVACGLMMGVCFVHGGCYSA